MSSDSPVSIILDIAGKEVSVSDGYAVSNGNKGFSSLGSDGTNLHFLKTNSSGQLVIVGSGTAGSSSSGVVSIQGIASGTVVPISVASLPLPTGASTETTLAKLTISQGTALGSNTNTLIGGAVSTSAPTYSNGNINPLSLTTDGLLRVDTSGATQAVSQSGTWTVQPGNTANTTAWMVKGPVVDNAAFTDGTTPVQPAGFIFDETAGTSLTENDAAAARVDSKRAQVIAIEDATTRGRRLTVTAGGAILVDGSATTQPVSFTASTTGSAASVNASITAVTLLASNSSRKGATFYNTSTSILYLKLGSSATTSLYTIQIATGGYYECPAAYNGIITGIWTSTNGSCMVCELT